MTSTSDNDRVVHPGEVLFDWIIDSGHTQKWLAETTGVSLKHVNHIVRGRSLYSEQFAIRLGEITDKPARFWNQLRSDFRLAEAVRKADEAKAAARKRTRRGSKTT